MTARPRRRRATLRSAWWLSKMADMRHCHSCGGHLERRYVKEERRRRFVCRSCGAIAYVNPKIVAGLIPVMPDGRIVLGRRAIEPALGKWTYPAGYMELGETVADAARREAWEEMRVEVGEPEFAGIYSYPDAAAVMIVFHAPVSAGSRPRAASETLEVKSFRKSEIPWPELSFRSTVHALRDFIANPASRPRSKRAKIRS